MLMPPVKERRKPVCPVCQSAEILPIEYGLPGPEIMRAAVEGKIYLGGCCVTGGEPNRYCSHCGYKWREERTSGVPLGHED